MRLFRKNIIKIEPKRNAVIISYDDNGKPSITVECKDYAFEYPLVLAARELLRTAPVLRK